MLRFAMGKQRPAKERRGVERHSKGGEMQSKGIEKNGDGEAMRCRGNAWTSDAEKSEAKEKVREAQKCGGEARHSNE